jgi:hypothetical protein
MRTRENFSVGHPSQIASRQARLIWRFFRDRLPKKKMQLVGMNTLLILLSLGPGYPILEARISHIKNNHLQKQKEILEAKRQWTNMQAKVRQMILEEEQKARELEQQIVFLSNLSNILSHLSTLNVILSSSCHFF